MGIRGIAHNWLTSYLRNRKQTVHIHKIVNGKHDFIHSSVIEIKRGVPQGSILGPLLFTLYVNDIASFINPVKCTLYADDINVLVTGKTEDETTTLINRTLECIDSWTHTNELNLNTDKTICINFSFPGQKKTLLSESMNKHKINQSQATKFLGVHISFDLTWKLHLESLNKELGSLCFAFYRLQGSVDRTTLLTLYFGKVQSLLAYGIIFWGGSTLSKTTFKVQKKY